MPIEKPTSPPKTFRGSLRWLWIQLLSRTAVLSWVKRQVARKGVVVMTFHRVLPREGMSETCSQAGMLVSEETWEKLLEYASTSFEVIPLAGGMPPFDREPSKPRVVFTFDDGWRDNFSVAFPRAKKHSIPLAIFLSTGRLGCSAPFWPEQVVRLFRVAENSRGGSAKLVEMLNANRDGSWPRGPFGVRCAVDEVIEFLKVLSTAERDRLIEKMMSFVIPEERNSHSIDSTISWDEVRALSAETVIFGSHTHSHEILPLIPPSKSRWELTESKQQLEARLGSSCEVFSYPNGSWSADVRELVAQAGYRLAFINDPGIWSETCDPFLIPRLHMWEGALVDPSGRFSHLAFEYAVFWRAYWASFRQQRTRKGTVDPHSLAPDVRQGSTTMQGVGATVR